MWTKGQYGHTLESGGKAVLGEGCRASCDELAGRLIFGDQNSSLSRWIFLCRAI